MPKHFASVAALACVLLLSITSAPACTVFCDSQGDTVLAGRSFDIPTNPHLGLQLVPAADGKHGWFGCGYFDYPWADGMNDQGLFAAVADVPALHTSRSAKPPQDLPAFLSGLLGNCSTVDEAIAWCRKQPTPSLGGWVHHGLMGGYTFDTPQHILVADRSGDSVVFEWLAGKLKVTRKHDRYQLMTNFLLSDPTAGGLPWSYPCPRFIADSTIFSNAPAPSLATCRKVLETTSAQSTRYSLVCDLTHGDVHVYLRRDFDQPKTFHLADELQKGRRELDMDEWFGRPKPELVSPPSVTGPAPLSAAEILQRALAARGGEPAAARIHSLHGKGTLDIGLGCLPPLPMEYYALPGRFRTVADLIQSPEVSYGQYIEGFDGRTGWNTYSGSRKILDGEEYKVRQDGAAFFGWYHQPGDDATSTCLGTASFDGKSCYVLKVVSKTHREYFRYYDTTDFLLAGSFSHAVIGTGWSKSTYGDYQAVEGFLLPTRIECQDETGRYPIHFSSLESNTVKESDLQMVAKTAP